MGFGPSPFSAWQWSKRGRFYPTPVASWPGIYPLLQYSIFCSFPTTTHWSTSSQTRLAHFWQSSPCFCCYAWNVQVKQLNCRCFRFLLDFDFFFTILIWKTEVFRTLGFYQDISVDSLEFSVPVLLRELLIDFIMIHHILRGRQRKFFFFMLYWQLSLWNNWWFASRHRLWLAAK